MNILEIKNVCKSFNKTKVLNDISFNVKENTIVGIVGPNGSGKSTLLKSITGLYKIDSGSIKIDGEEINKNFESCMSKIGCMIEEPIMYDYLTGRKNLELSRCLYGIKDKNIVRKVLKIVSLEKDADKIVKKYSLGMKQKLGLASVLMNEPKILILDEPTNGLDPLGIIELRNFLKSLSNTTIIICSHILSELENLCDEFIFIHKGKIVNIMNSKECKNLEQSYMGIILEDRKCN